MRSIGAGGVTVVTLITLVFAQLGHGHGRHLDQVGRSSMTVEVPCRADKPCPPQRTFNSKIVAPERSDGRGGDDGRTAVAATTTATAGAP